MLKKIFLILILFLFIGVNYTYSVSTPTVNCAGLPGCTDSSLSNPSPATNMSNNIGAKFIDSIVSEFIQIVAVIAVFALIISGLMYLVSGGEEEKTKKAKKWIIWSLVGVFLSISAWGIINFLNNISIG